MTLCVYFISIQRPIYLHVFSFDYDKGGCYAISLAILLFHYSSFYLKHFVAYNPEATEKFIHRLPKNSSLHLIRTCCIKLLSHALFWALCKNSL